MSHTEKYSVATFIEKIVLAKSYSAQLARSMTGARGVGWDDAGIVDDGWCMNPRCLIDGIRQRPKLPPMPFLRLRARPLHRATLPCSVAAAVVLLAACERRPASTRGDSLSPVVSAGTDSAARRRVASGWSAAAGPVLLI